jgi:histidinol dehydrogenase
MLAYGTTSTGGSVAPVDLITGPGNIYVAAAKRYLQGTVAIDSEAGPTEIAIIADDTADAAFVAADLVSQAEHDPMAAAVLITDSEALAGAVEAELERQVPAAKHAERITTALDGQQSAIALVRDVDQAVEVANAYAAEHLEIHTVDAASVADRIVNAGAIFVGSHTPVSLGDYAAGSNHVLPTAGCACHSSGLSVRAFCKNMHVVTYTDQALRDVGPKVVTLAEAEDLPSHGAAVSIRLER